MNVRTDLTAAIKIYVAKTVPANQPNTVSYAKAAMNAVRILFVKYVWQDSDHHMCAMAAKKSENVH